MSNSLVTSNAPLIRTDFTNNVVWQKIVDATAVASREGFLPSLSIVNDRNFSGTSAEHLAALVSKASEYAVLFVVDQMTIAHYDHPILCIKLPDPGPRKSIRVTPAELWCVENNLSLANMDFQDFANAADADGIFRGFRESGDGSNVSR